MTQTERDEAMSRIGDQRHPGVANKRDFCPLLKRNEQLWRARQFVVLVIADKRLANLVVIEKLLRVPRVFTRNLIDFLQYAQSAQRHIFEIANRRANKVQASQGGIRVGRSGAIHALESSMRCGDILLRMLYFFVWS